ncbi:integrase core domain-containing protein [Synergistaceae bacterium OttesenSCG-928-I11]|nr:integrase core domain-containing protein [Synergistaceae bacterium OttesenSCG-928-I11]
MTLEKFIILLTDAIAKCYLSYGVDIKIKHCKVACNGKRFIFQVKPRPGAKVTSILERAQDVRAFLGLPYFEVSSNRKSISIAVSTSPFILNSLSDILWSDLFLKSNMKIPLILGYDSLGNKHVVDLYELKHLFVSGTTNSGKTVCLNNIAICIALKQPVDKVNLIIIDTGARGLDLLSALPHLASPIVKDPEVAVKVISGIRKKMEWRIKLSPEELQQEPVVVLIIDEYISLILKVDDTDKNELISDGMILHSDRGSQYTSHEFRDALQHRSAVQSMSGTGRCYDNARMESFFATLKKEKLYKIKTSNYAMEEVRSIVHRYINYYNLRRIYSTNGGIPPEKYRQAYYDIQNAA